MDSMYFAWLAAFCGLMVPSSASLPGWPVWSEPVVDDVWTEDPLSVGHFDPVEIEKDILRVDGLLPQDLARLINTIKEVRDRVRDAELPSPFWFHEQSLLGILDDLWYELRMAYRDSQLEIGMLSRAAVQYEIGKTEGEGWVHGAAANGLNVPISVVSAETEDSRVTHGERSPEPRIRSLKHSEAHPVPNRARVMF